MDHTKEQIAAEIYMKSMSDLNATVRFENSVKDFELNMSVKRVCSNLAYDAICKAEAFMEMTAACAVDRPHVPHGMTPLWKAP